jgi:hypothetical protein
MPARDLGTCICFEVQREMVNLPLLEKPFTIPTGTRCKILYLWSNICLFSQTDFFDHQSSLNLNGPTVPLVSYEHPTNQSPHMHVHPRTCANPPKAKEGGRSTLTGPGAAPTSRGWGRNFCMARLDREHLGS